MSDYKTKYKKQLTAAKTGKKQLVKKALDSKQTTGNRVKALQFVSAGSDKNLADKTSRLFKDTKQDASLRAAALTSSAARLGKDENLMDEAIAIIADTSQPAVLRHAAFDAILTSTFTSDLLMAKHLEFVATLKRVATVAEKDKKLREKAVEYLAQNTIEGIDKDLIAGLKDPAKKLVEPEAAIHYLSYYLHQSADGFAALRDVAKNPPNRRSKIEALRNLGDDPKAKDLLVATLKSKKEDGEVRHACAIALSQADLPLLQSIAEKIILDAKEDEELKAALLNTLTFCNPDKSTNLYGNDDFRKKLDNVNKKTKSPKLKKMYDQFTSDANHTNITEQS